MSINDHLYDEEFINSVPILKAMIMPPKIAGERADDIEFSCNQLYISGNYLSKQANALKWEVTHG